MSKRPAEWLHRTENWLWKQDDESRRPSVRYSWHLARILFAVVRDVMNGHITLHAMSLVYTTLLSIVPMLALSFSVLKGLGAHNELEPLLKNLVEPLGHQGEEIVTNVLVFVDNMQVGVLGSLGLAFLIFTVISLVQKVERSFNEIWRVSQIRPMGQRFSNYLSVIIVGPVLVVSAVGSTATLVGSDMVKNLLLIQPLGWMFSTLSSLMPYLMIMMLFTFVYIFIPNTRVRFKHALLGGVIAGAAWQTAIFGFTRFVVNSNYEAIYSGFAVGILLLIWIYVAWLILLMGASVAFYSQHATQITRERVVEPCARMDEMTALEIVYRVARQFDTAGGGLNVHELESELAVGPEVTERVIERLTMSTILSFAGGDADQLCPAQSLDRIALADVLYAIRRPDRSKPEISSNLKEVETVANQLDSAIEYAFSNVSLQDWVRGKSSVSSRLADVKAGPKPASSVSE